MRRRIGRRGRKIHWFDSGGFAARSAFLYCMPLVYVWEGSLARLDGCDCGLASGCRVASMSDSRPCSTRTSRGRRREFGTYPILFSDYPISFMMTLAGAGVGILPSQQLLLARTRVPWSRAKERKGPCLYVCTEGSRRACGVGACPRLLPTKSDPRETSGPRIDRIPPTRPPWWRRQFRELKN